MKLKEFNFIGAKKISLSVSAALIAVILLCSLIFGVRLSVQFSGGTIVTYTYEGEINAGAIQSVAKDTVEKELSVNMKAGISGLDSFEIVLDEKEGLDSELQAKLDAALAEKFADNNVTFLSNSTVNPTIGSEFFIKSLVAIGFAAVLIVIYVAFRFKKISGWSAGVMALVALLHDVLIAFGVFVMFRIPLDFNFVAVVLTILGYSINDTIIIYDRMRENQRLYGSSMTREQLANRSINETLSRTVNTTITTLFAIAMICIVAVISNVESILSFSFPLLIGMISGTYSTIFIVCPLWCMWQAHKDKKKPKQRVAKHR